MRLLPLLVPALSLLELPPTSAYGQLGHKTVALLASRFFTPKTARTVRALVGPRQTLLSLSVWPDSYAHVPAGTHTAPWHYINSHDRAPHSCSVSYSRDCAGACVVSALTNMSARVADETLPWKDRHDALAFVVHLVADIHQPLHTDGLLKGGNGIHVRWRGRETSLHHVWDSAMPEEIVGGAGPRHVARWTEDLYRSLVDDEGEGGDATLRVDGDGKDGDADQWRTQSGSPGSRRNLTRPEHNCLVPGHECVLQWAQQTNAWMCAFVLPPSYPDGLVGAELGGEYFDGAVPIVEELVAQAGWRLGGWLNALLDPGVEGAEEVVEGVVVEEEEVEEWSGMGGAEL